MHPNALLIRRFYVALANRDATGMAACYHPAVQFSDEVFPDLRGTRAGAMWRMLCERGKDLKIDSHAIEADDRTGRASWEAWYTFSATGRRCITASRHALTSRTSESSGIATASTSGHGRRRHSARSGGCWGGPA